MDLPETQQGYIKSWRKILDNEFLKYDNTAYILFTKLLHMVDLKTGKHRTGRYMLAERTNLKPMTAYKALKRLESNRLVTLSSDRNSTIIFICNWGKYQQSGNSTGNNLVTTREQPGNNLVTLNKNKEQRSIRRLLVSNKKLEPEIIAFIEFRKSIKKPMTQRAVELLEQKLEQMYPNDFEAQRAVLSQSILNGWQGVFELKEQTKAGLTNDDKINRLIAQRQYREAHR